jgi:pimeloyl-ACP methyl ester carboxylesterase
MTRHPLFQLLIAAVIVQGVAIRAFPDGPKDNVAKNVRPVPRVGIQLTAAQKADFDKRMSEFKSLLDKLKAKKDPRTQELLPDIEIFYRAVRTNIDHRELFGKRDVYNAAVLTNEGRGRAHDLLTGMPEPVWPDKTGLVVRGYRSKIDGTVQPYGLVVPKSYDPKSERGYRLDIWFHGRGETLSETNFIAGRMRSRGIYTPKNAFVLHPYGRYCNANKFAGEIDVLEALADVRRRYRIDPDRISVRGFSMGGAACWQFAVHYADRWFAANPGAGFSETPLFLKVFQKETLKPTWYEQKLWNMYDCPGYAINLYHCPTIAYSGELDSQKQAADVMQAALKKVRIDMLHIIGPKMHHQIHPVSAKEIERRMYALAKAGRDHNPRSIRFATFTLKYNRMHWITVNALGEHWKRAWVDADVLPNNRLDIRSGNVTDLTVSMPPGSKLLDIRSRVRIFINGIPFVGPQPKSDRSFTVRFHRVGRRWRIVSEPDAASVRVALAKRHNLQGPIDDAFMDSFIFVKPAGKARHDAVEKWTQSELAHAVREWRRQFRGDARVKSADKITPTDIANSNLILFGDPASNPLIAKIAGKLPIKWGDKQITVGGKNYDAAQHAPILIYPNPLNPKKYVVLNSGFTYREYAYLNNARQVPMLPDWAVIDLRTPPGAVHPGKVVDAGFFGEGWELKSGQ